MKCPKCGYDCIQVQTGSNHLVRQGEVESFYDEFAEIEMEVIWRCACGYRSEGKWLPDFQVLKAYPVWKFHLWLDENERLSYHKITGYWPDRGL